STLNSCRYLHEPKTRFPVRWLVPFPGREFHPLKAPGLTWRTEKIASSLCALHLHALFLFFQAVAWFDDRRHATHFGPLTRRDHNGNFQGTTAIHAVIYTGGDLSHTSRPYV
ncbi:hypothetical protein, partial [Paraburkholderia solitsugae]|uniref:hypothetical protein n=1 Tax=Paraburkholderia solitsugae TaxID=2675748 RepID=UPI001C132823